MAKVLLGRSLWVLPTCTVVCKSYHSLSENHFCGCKKGLITLNHCTEVRFASFLSGGFTTTAVINPPERKLSKRNSVHWHHFENLYKKGSFFNYRRKPIPKTKSVFSFFKDHCPLMNPDLSLQKHVDSIQNRVNGINSFQIPFGVYVG